MFNLLNKNKEPIICVTDGTLITLDETSDPVFSQKIMGDGYAVIPENGKVYAPVSGTIGTIFPTKHAISIRTAKGLDILIHMGFDTVEMNGKPFKIEVTQNQKVNAGDLLAKINLKLISESNLDTTISVVYTEMNLLKSFPKILKGNISAKEAIGDLYYK